MNFRRRLLAYSAAMAALAATAPGIPAQEVGLDYVSHPVDSAEALEYWGDQEESFRQEGELVPEVLVARVRTERGPLTVTVLVSGGACGNSECPVRIFRDGEKVADLAACSNVTSHAVNSSGSVFAACDDVFNIADDFNVAD